jgi:hypothetical protein
MLSTLAKAVSLFFSCVAHPEVLGVGFLIGWLCPGQIGQALTAAAIVINPFLGAGLAAAEKLLSAALAAGTKLLAAIRAKL